ncbi:uncharacterized protein TNCV_2861401 [Trichonephila clavipes]|nr:uncharacterized protein TNCV_2861401 [Trichonephila clavipes]
MAEGNVYPSEEDFSYFCFDFRNEAKETDKRNPYVGAMGPCFTCSYCGYVFEAVFKSEKVNSIGTASLCFNGDRCRAMITNFFIPQLNNHDVQELWFQQDGATCHTARATIDLLKDTLGDRLISRFGPVNWPPKSCELTPLDYFLWGY